MIEYVLSYTEPRAHTVDTVILGISENRENLQDLVLSIIEEAAYVAFNEVIQRYPEYSIDKILRRLKVEMRREGEKYHITPIKRFD